MNLSSTYFSDLFYKEFKIRPMKHITKLRVERAQELLSNTPKKSIEIATVCGFKTSQYFHKIFKKETGMTPKEYRTYTSVHS
jgi:AraC-like DNA-binding protein